MSARAEIQNVAQLFFQQAERQAHVPAICEGEREISYGDLAKEVCSYASFLKAKGVKKSDRILIFMPISIRLYVVVLAVMQLGAIAVFLDPWSDLKRLKASAKLAHCKGIIAQRKLRLLSHLLPVFWRIPLKLSPFSRAEKPFLETQMVQPNDTALITFTTGSSGKPKGANRTHEFLNNQLEALRKEITPLEQDVCLTNLPVFTLSHLAEGYTSVIANYNPRKPGKMKIENIYPQLQQNGVKTMVVSPDFLLRLCKSRVPSNLALKRVFTGGAPVFPDQAVQIAQAFPHAETVVAYGSTEAEPISSIPLKALLKDKGLKLSGLPVGKVHPDCELKVITWKDELIQPTTRELAELEKMPGEIGEIIVSGPHVLKEYYKNQEAQQRQKFLVNGKLWHRTGDSGFRIEDQLYLTGSCKQLIADGESYFAPFLTEYQLRLLDSVIEGTLVEHGGQKTLYLVKSQKASKQQVEEELTSSHVPFDNIHYLRALPKDPRHNSKIDYNKLI